MNKESRISGRIPRFPLPGQRIMRSVVSVWICILIYFIRGQKGEPFYSVIAALQCLQPYSSNMLSEGRERITGTLIGAFCGAVIVFSDLLPVGDSFRVSVVHYSLLGILTGLVIYSTVLLNIARYALFSAVVFLGISMYHLEDVNPYLHVFYRTLETIIGVGVAIVVNSFHLPRTRDRTTLFVSGIDHVLFREDRQLSRFTTVELNRFLDDGMRFTVSTRQTPATVRELLSSIHLRLPIIAMDGAVLYNLNTMNYIRTVKMEPGLVKLVTDFLNSEGIPFFTNTVQDNLLVIYFRDYKDLILEEVRDAYHDSRPHNTLADLNLSKSAYLSMARLYRKNVSLPTATTSAQTIRSRRTSSTCWSLTGRKRSTASAKS
ncbi:MAG: FUSC family protein [Eubacteriales bacterium]|nr:FUSC family protein [Eubacteriales bacterium]